MPLIIIQILNKLLGFLGKPRERSLINLVEDIHVENSQVAQEIPAEIIKSKWSAPVPSEYFVLSQAYLNEDRVLYPKFGHHTGVDYGGHKQIGIPVFACFNGELIYSDIADSPWGLALGNHVALYVPAINKSFLYCHFSEAPHVLGPVKSGEQIGVMGNTGKSSGGAVHLHLEGYHGRFDIKWRSFVSIDDIKTRTFDSDQLIRELL